MSGFVFKEGAFRRTANVVRIVENWKNEKPPVVVQPPVEVSDGEQIRIGTIAETWAKGSAATVTQLNGDTTEYLSGTTFTAYNWVGDVAVASGTRTVTCANVGGTWVLVSVTDQALDLTTLPGYDPTATQVLANDAGTFRWIALTDCASVV